MATLRHKLIGAGLAAARVTRLHAPLARWTRGRGAILAFHRVRPAAPAAFAPNRLLEITPEYLDAVLHHVRRKGYAIVPLAEVPDHLAAAPSRPALALTFDDGYRDNLVHALPVLERHRAPFTLFVTTGFAERTARLWWVELERAVATARQVVVPLDGRSVAFATATVAGKDRAFAELARRFRHLPGPAIDAALAALGHPSGEAAALVDQACLGWDELVQLARHPLATLGCHTLTHPNLRLLTAADLRHELVASRRAIEAHVDRAVTFLAYPYGGRDAAGPREFAAAQAAGFTAAVTTQPGVLRARHAGRPAALPRLSVNGLWPDTAVLDVLLSGAPFLPRDLLRPDRG